MPKEVACLIENGEFVCTTNVLLESIQDDAKIAPKHSQAYFEERIRNLQTKIVQTIPKQEDIVGTVFLPLMTGIEAAQSSLAASNSLKKKLEDAQRKHPEDDGYKSLTDPLNESLKEMKIAISNLEEGATNAGCDIVKDSALNENIQQVEAELLECTVLVQATPKKLAEWCAQSPNMNGKLLDEFLGQSSLMAAFLLQGGPSHGNYGPALSIYNQLQSELEHCNDKDRSATELLQRLVLAVALEHATPVQIFKQQEFVDPLERFRYFAKLVDNDDDKLDEAFYNLSVWELRKVIDANATHADLTWGRQYLRNYRPDEITLKDEKWRYVRSVRTDVGYRHPDHDFTNYQQLISAGGECGPRAFFGRFVCKSWGIPTWGVRQPGHAAMTRYTSKEWVVVLGADWPYSWWDEDRYCGGISKSRHGPDFLEETRARNASPEDYYREVVLVECLAEIMGETVEEDFCETKFWRSLAIAKRKYLAQESNIACLQNDTTLEASCKSTSDEWLSVKVEGRKAKRHYNNASNVAKQHGQSCIVIPAASFVNKPSKNVMILDSFGGGKQLHLEHDGKVEYELPASVEAGTYELSAKLVNVHRAQQPLLVQVENHNSLDGYEIVDLPQGQELEVPYTKGYWQGTQSIRIDLGAAGGRLRFSRKQPCWGLSIKEFVLKSLEK